MNDTPDNDLPPDAVAAAPDAEAKPARRRRRAPREGSAASEGGANEAPVDGTADGGTTPGPTAAVESSVEVADRPRRKRRRGRKGKGPREGQPGGEAMPQGGGVPIERPPMPDAGELFANVTAGQFDSEVEAVAEEPVAVIDGSAEVPVEDAAPERRVLAPDADAPKLQKVLAQSGVGSRRDLEQMIVDGRVSVNDVVAHVGQRVSWGDRVAIDGKPVRVRIAPLPTRVIAYHKPTGEVVTLDDPEGRPTVFRRLPRLVHGKWQSVGRLDINTEGLLLFTTSGELANRLMHPRFGIEREYAVRVLGQLSPESKAKLLAGVPIDGQPCAFQRIEDGGGEGANHWYRVVINEGRNREVRKLFDSVGMAVSRLIRIRYGSVVLPRGLKRGVAVDLSEDDVALLRRLTGLGEGRGPRPQGHDKPRGRGRTEGGAAPAREPREVREPREPREAKEPRSHLSRDLKPPRPGRRGNSNKVSLHDGFGDAALRAREHEFDDHHHDEPPPAEFVNIPNPLEQTFDRRAAREAARPQRELSDDAPIPNPLQQTYDQRALKAATRTPEREIDDDGPIPNPLQQTYDKRFHKGGPAGGGGGGGPRRGGGGGGKKRGGGGAKPMGGGQPDPMRTAVGYIGADALHGKKGPRGGGGGGRGRRSGPKGR